jgi:two-component system sensor histidine kinase CiaH
VKTIRIRKLFKSSTLRVALSYLAIIMIMSIFFSLVFYNTSIKELNRQLPPPSFYEGLQGGPPPVPRNEVDQFLRDRISEGQSTLMLNLVMLNVLALFGGSFISYFLARYTLHPIENALDAQSRFISDASHELKTPLTVIQAGNEVALRKSNLSVDEAKEVIQSNVEEIIKLRQLSDCLLTLASQEHRQLVLEPVSIQDAVSEALNRVVQLAVSRDIGVIDNIRDIEVTAEEQGLVEVLVILFDNAIKYSYEGKNIFVNVYKKGKHGVISVRDEGPGIRATDQKYIFERFYRANTARTKNTNSSYGLGLSIAKKIVEQNKGNISVESTLDKGSTFSIKLPLA